MANYIRAGFCLDNPLDLTDLWKLREILDGHACNSIGDPNMDQGKWYSQRFTWEILNKSWEARLFQISHGITHPSMISFDVDDLLFMPNSKISYQPNSDPLFDAYKEIIINIIQFIRPFIGIIDFDADILCGEFRSNSFAAWGNFLSNRFLDTWNSEDINWIEKNLEIIFSIKGIGKLIFNHPLGYVNGDRSDHQFHLWRTIESYIGRLAM